MPQQRTFDNQSYFHPKKTLTEPAVWVHRMVLLESGEATDSPIRKVTFRQGLNIIATAKPKRGESEPVGHNVGKTLLTRLIRYCLGEGTYARGSVRREIEAQFPEGLVVAEIYVQGTLWTVVRPLVTGVASASKAWPATTWREALATDQRGPFAAYLSALEAATTEQFTSVVLPGQGRHVAWRDLLAWLSRDQHCAYRDPLEWRDRWTESGTPELSVEDRSLLVRLAMDLVAPAEEQMIQEKQKLQDRRRQVADELRERTASLDRTREFLIHRLGADVDHLESGLFASHAKDQIEAAIETQNEKLEKIARRYDLPTVETELRETQRVEIEMTTTLKLRQFDLTKEETLIEDAKNQARNNLDNGKIVCPLKQNTCSVYEAELNDPDRLDYRLQTIQEKKARVATLKKEIRQLERKLETQREAVTEARVKVEQAQKQIRGRSAQPRRRILERELILKELDDYQPLQAEIEKLERRSERLEKKWDKLAAKHRDLARSARQKLKRLNNSFEIVQQRLLGRTPENSIRINVNRLTFTGDDQETSPGEGMATSATVTLDLACLHAGLEGLGHLPRLLIHDSPRGGDLETHLYAHLFEFALELEKAFAKPPPFQYIIATTTSPPYEVLKRPYVVLELNAKDPNGLLLKRQY